MEELEAALTELRLHLSSSDHSIHSLRLNPMFDDLRLVKLVKRRLLSIVERELERRPGQSVSGVVERVLQSSDFVQERERLESECVELCSQLGGLPKGRQVSAPAQLPDEPSRPRSGLSSVTSDWLTTGSLAQSSVLFSASGALSRAITVLAQTDADAHTKQCALHQLMQMPSAEIAQHADWQRLRQLMPDLCLDSDVFDDALRLLVKMFNTANASTLLQTVSTTTAIVAAACNYSPKVKKLTWGDRREEDEQIQLVCQLKTFRVWHRMLLALPALWIRYPENEVAEVISEVLDVFEKEVTDQCRYMGKDPLVCMALMDTKISWFRSWLNQQRSRHQMLIAWRKSNKFMLRRIISAAVDGNVEAGLVQNVFLNYTNASIDVLLRSYLHKCALVLLKYASLCDQIFPVHSFGSQGSLSSHQLFSALLRTWFRKEASGDPNFGYLHDWIVRLSRSHKFWSLLLQPLILAEIRQMLCDRTAQWQVKATLLEISHRALIVDARDTAESTRFWKFIAEYCCDSLEALVKDGAQYHQSFIGANLRMAQTLCLKQQTRHFVAGVRYLRTLSVLVQNDICESDQMPWFMAMFGGEEQSLKRFRRTFYSSDVTGLLQHPIHVGPTLIDCFMKQLDQLLSITPAPNLANIALAATAEKLFAGAVPLRPLVFSLACRPGVADLCVTDQRFKNFALKSLHENCGVGLSVLYLLASNLDFAVALETNLNVASTLHQMLVDDGVWSHDRSLVSALYFRLILIAGPKERILCEASCPSLAVADHFQAEPSRFLAKQTTVGPAEVPSDLLNYLLETLESKQRPPYLAIIDRCATDIQTQSANVSRKAEKRVLDWNLMLEYGLNLKLLSEKHKALAVAKTVESRISYSANSNREGTDWLVAVLLLLLEDETDLIVRLLGALETNEAISVWPFWAGAEAFCGSVASDVWPMVEALLEHMDFAAKIALESARLSVLSLITLWINQCFLNFLDWPEVCNYVTGCLVGGHKFQACFCVCVIMHMQDDIKLHSHVSDLPWLFTQRTLETFKMHNFVAMFRDLFCRL